MITKYQQNAHLEYHLHFKGLSFLVNQQHLSQMQWSNFCPFMQVVAMVFDTDMIEKQCFQLLSVEIAIYWEL